MSSKEKSLQKKENAIKKAEEADYEQFRVEIDYKALDEEELAEIEDIT